MNEKMISFYMDVAKRTAELSYAKRLKVGCILVVNDNIVSFSYNGTPRGWNNECEDLFVIEDSLTCANMIEYINNGYKYNNINNRWEKLVTKDCVSHAEEAMILKMAKSNQSSINGSLFTNIAPCIVCSRLIYGAGISEVYYSEEYKNITGISFLKECGIKIYKV